MGGAIVDRGHAAARQVLDALERVQRSIGLDRNGDDLGIQLAQPPRGADERSRGADSGDQVRDLATGLAP